MRDPLFIFNRPVSIEETLHHEFKEVKGGNPVNIIKNAVDEYAVAFLNSDGGSIYWGIRDSDRCVVGVGLAYKERDSLRKVVMDKLFSIQPSITPNAFRIPIHQIYEDEARSAPVPDRFVFEVKIPHTDPDNLYFTGSNEAFVKTAAGKKKLSGPELQDEILRRLQKKAKAQYSVNTQKQSSLPGLSPVLRRAELVAPVIRGARVLWVDDSPGNNISERLVLKSLGITAEIATSTEEALQFLEMETYDVIISDMARDGQQQAGLQMLKEIRSRGISSNLVFYLWGYDESLGTPKGAFAITKYPDELLHYLLDILERVRI